MSKWHSLLEFMQFPLKILFLATVLLGVGSAIINPNVAFLWSVTNQNIIRASEMFRYIGAFLINIFPVLVYLKVLSKKFEDSVPVIVGVIAYLLINISMTFFLDTTFPSYFYKEVLGISINFDVLPISGSGIVDPYNMGIFSLVISYFITMKCYQHSRHHSVYGIFSFIDHDAWAVITILILSVVSGVALAFIWPYIIQGLNLFFDLIAKDITNPINLMLYGMFERISAILGLVDIPRNIFWFTSSGGTWMNEVGLNFFGDVAIWTAQKAQGVQATTTGGFITPYYVINLFIIPAFYIAYYSLCTSRKDRGRYWLFFLLAILISVFCGNPLPAEFLILLLSPMLYGFYIVIVGLLYAFLHIFNVIIGYNFSDALLFANPGAGLDLIQYFRSAYVLPSLMKMLIIGLGAAILFVFLTRAYFSKYAFGLFQFVDKEKTTNEIINALGGIDNIIDAQSTPDKLTVELKNRELIDYAVLQSYGAYLILEAKGGYLIRLGNMSTIIRNEILRRSKSVAELNLRKKLRVRKRNKAEEA
ncbi:hypothetical protein [Dielma fastidiosa]|uniref:PTS EIIB type-1 domain-containing protein n=1 Tax=Dielma fastidiosa TaxID=1034346 RepID=A0AB35UQY5_9FIRM|nr:hypothetical protein [Dielma fastidiosa]MDY5169206.1 hypothetical protein [Dielma fastidiosa]